MSWIGLHASELNAMGSIFMNFATIVIIVFNLNQLKLNNRTLNVDINFKVFELRKKLYKDIAHFVNTITLEKGFRPYLVEEEHNEFTVNDTLTKLQENIENCKYLFAAEISLELEMLLLNIQQGIATEKKVQLLKSKDSNEWSSLDQTQMHDLGARQKEIIESLQNFNHEQFLPYLNVSNFHRDLMNDASFSHNNRKLSKVVTSGIRKFSQIIIAQTKSRPLATGNTPN